MKRALLFFLYTLSLPSASQDIKFASFNIASSTFERYLAKDDNSSCRWSNRKNTLVYFINLKSPDVIALQEVSELQFADLKEELTQYTFQRPKLKDREGYDYTLAIAYRKKRFSQHLNESQFMNISSDDPSFSLIATSAPGRSKCRRPLFWLRLYDRENRRAFLVFNSHYPAGPSTKDESLRRCFFQFEMARIEKSDGFDTPFISLGDRNLINDKDGTRFLIKERFHRSYFPNKSSRGLKTTWIGFDQDPYKNELKDGNFRKKLVFDMGFFAGFKHLSSETTIAELGDENLMWGDTFYKINERTKEGWRWLRLDRKKNKTAYRSTDKKRLFISDHAMIIATLRFSEAI